MARNTKVPSKSKGAQENGRLEQSPGTARWRALEHLDEVHWLASQHVAHLTRLAAAFDELGLAAVTRDFRESAATWDRLLHDIEEAQPPCQAPRDDISTLSGEMS
jgi:hypothetical protein